MTAFTDSWLAQFSDRVNEDPEMAVIGDWFTTAFSLTCGDRRSIVRFEKGKLVEIIASPRIDARCTFGFRASEDIWSKFLSPQPEPLYHDFFAMLMRVPGFVLEGDTLAAMQNAAAHPVPRMEHAQRTQEAPTQTPAQTPARTAVAPGLPPWITKPGTTP